MTSDGAPEKMEEGWPNCADVAELADALDSGSSSRKGVEVQVLSSAPIKSRTYKNNHLRACPRETGHCNGFVNGLVVVWGALTKLIWLGTLFKRSQIWLEPLTPRIFSWRIEANIRLFFGHPEAPSLTTEKLKDYRRNRRAAGREEPTCNREISILRIAMNLGRKRTPPKVDSIPNFPMVKEENARQGFLTDQQYAKLRDELLDYLKPVVCYCICHRRPTWRTPGLDLG